MLLLPADSFFFTGSLLYFQKKGKIYSACKKTEVSSGTEVLHFAQSLLVPCGPNEAKQGGCIWVGTLG
jgi:hypothetical protein